MYLLTAFRLAFLRVCFNIDATLPRKPPGAPRFIVLGPLRNCRLWYRCKPLMSALVDFFMVLSLSAASGGLCLKLPLAFFLTRHFCRECRGIVTARLAGKLRCQNAVNESLEIALGHDLTSHRMDVLLEKSSKRWVLSHLSHRCCPQNARTCTNNS